MLQDVADAKACAPILCLHRDGHGNVWSGHVNGGVGVWSESRRALCCPIFRACKSDIRCQHGIAAGCTRGVVYSMSGPPLGSVIQQLTLACCRALASDGSGHTYVGGSSGNVKALRLRFTGARNNCCVEAAGTLRLRVSHPTESGLTVAWRSLSAKMLPLFLVRLSIEAYNASLIPCLLVDGDGGGNHGRPEVWLNSCNVVRLMTEPAPLTAR